MRFILLAACLWSTCLSLATAQQTWFVRSNGPGGTGRNWGQALPQIQAALDSAQTGDTIWIARGTYRTPNDTVGFHIEKDITLLGGFSGTETRAIQRNPLLYQTILSADVKGDDLPVRFDTLREDNSYHVLFVAAGATATISGFGILGGHTDLLETQPGYETRGGGVYSQGRVHIDQCIFSSHFALSGGAICLASDESGSADSSTVRNCLFQTNIGIARGGGIHLIQVYGATISGCQFRNNLSNRGIVYPFECDGLVMINCQLTDNLNTFPDGFSAGFFSLGSTNTYILNSLFKANTATNAAALYDGGNNFSNYPEPNLVLNNCRFESDTAEQRGGALWLDGTFADISKCSFSKNEATASQGGAIFATITLAVIDSCTFTGNVSGSFGGAASFNTNNILLLSNSKFEGNEAASGGGALVSAINSYSSMADCHFENNYSGIVGGAVYYFSPDTSLVNRCTFTGNTSDQLGGAISNNGASPGVWLIDSQLDDNLAADNGGGVFAFGEAVTYTDNTLFKANYAAYGGGFSAQDAGTYTRINGSRFESNIAENGGGAIAASFQPLTEVSETEFENNKATFAGAFYSQNDSTRTSLEACTFQSNQAIQLAGGIWIRGAGLAEISNSLFEGNQSDGPGGALDISYDTLTRPVVQVNRSIFRFNTANDQAGAINVGNGDVTLTNCLLYNNLADGDGRGGAISNNGSDGLSSDIRIIHCTLADNTGEFADGMSNWTDPEDTSSHASITLINSILAQPLNYRIEDGKPLVISLGGNLSTDTSLQSYFTTADQRETDPAFVDAADENYHLSAESPCIDAGVMPAGFNLPNLDLDGQTRSGIPDIGALEYRLISGVKEEQPIQGQLLLFPNPLAGQVLQIDFGQSGLVLHQTVDVQITDLPGREVYRGRLSPAGIQPLNIGHLPSGMYLVSVRQGPNRYSQKLLVQQP